MESIELGKVVKFLDHLRVPVTESDRSIGRFPYYGANGVQGFVDDFIFDEPLVLLAEDGGHFGSKTRPIAFKVEGKYWVNNHAHVLRPKSDCNIDYLHRVLSYYDVTHYINGATRPKLTKGNAERMPIPFPSLPEQKRIAAILDKADRLRSQRRFAQTLSDSFLQSVFIKMFGNPVANEMGWDTKEVKQLGKVKTGGTPPSVMDNMFDGTIPFITPGDLEVNTKKSKRYVSEAGALQSETVRAGSTLVCCIGATIGKMDKAEIKCAFNQQINAIDWTNTIHDDFGLWLMRFFARTIARKGSSTTLPILKKSTFEEISVIHPPLPLQEKFAAIVQKFERIRRQQREATRQAEHLFQTLLHRAFRGDL